MNLRFFGSAGLIGGTLRKEIVVLLHGGGVS